MGSSLLSVKDNIVPPDLVNGFGNSAKLIWKTVWADAVRLGWVVIGGLFPEPAWAYVKFRIADSIHKVTFPPGVVLGRSVVKGRVNRFPPLEMKAHKAGSCKPTDSLGRKARTKKEILQAGKSFCITPFHKTPFIFFCPSYLRDGGQKKMNDGRDLKFWVLISARPRAA